MAIFRLLGFMLMLMVTAIASLFVGVDEAVDRIAYSWIEQATGQGILIGYNPVTREGVRMAAALLLAGGWFLTILTVGLVVALIAKY